MIAKVIVDVPTGQTNRLYDYKIPEEMEEFVQPGMKSERPIRSPADSRVCYEYNRGYGSKTN